MFERVTIRAADLAASERFYATVLATLGLEPGDWREFRVAAAGDEHPVTRGLHIGFAAPSRAVADEFWRAGTAAGYRDDGAPGPRPQYGPDYYGAFLLDPDGNSAEAVHHDGLGGEGAIDHLWIRVADVAAARGFYADLAPRTGFALRTDTAERAQFKGPSASFSVVAGTPTVGAALGFAADRGELVRDPDGNTVELVASLA